MSKKYNLFYRGKQAVSVDFSAKPISSDGAAILLDKIERKHKLIARFSELFQDTRDPNLIQHSTEKLLKQRVFLMMQGYEDANDVEHLKNDPVLEDLLSGLASQPTISRFENSMTTQAAFEIMYAWIDRYVETLVGRSRITIDVDATADPTHGAQQLTLFNGFYGQFMYSELLFHDGDTGQLVLPILRPGNSHSNKWFVGLLRRIINRIYTRFPYMQITIRADAGFSGPAFYKFARKQKLYYAIGMSTNEVLKKVVETEVSEVIVDYVDKNKKHQHFVTNIYQANSWEVPERCITKIESTGKGINVRHMITNIVDEKGEPKTGQDIYRNFYVKRGDSSENRIKELKNMCFSDRLSNHTFLANYCRLIISCLAYEMFLLLKQMIKQTSVVKAYKWQVNTIRTLLLKVGATVKKTKRRIYYSLSEAFVHKDLFRQLILQ